MASREVECMSASWHCSHCGAMHCTARRAGVGCRGAADAIATRRLAAPIGRQLAAGILMDTAPMGFDPGPTLNEWPMELTSLQGIIDERASQHTAR